MKKILILILFLPFISYSQITDDFSDGNFTTNPSWSGDISKFKINNNSQLQLDGTIADTSILCLQTNMTGNIEWNIWVKLSFSPSDNNNLRIYLLSNNQDLKSPLNGYYIKIGENGADDSIDLYRQDSVTMTKIIDGITGNVSLSTNSFLLKITRDNQYNWKVFSDISSAGLFTSQGNCIDSTYTSGIHFGIFCKYTSSNSTKFYFDDIYIGDIIIDSIPPTIISHSLTEELKVQISFSESIDPVSLQNLSNFYIPSLNSYSQSVEVITPSDILLEFDQNLQSQINYSMSVTGLFDENENQINDTIIEFSYFITGENDLIINEIMADPYPPVDLSEIEYIEIYNASGRNLDISGFILQIGETSKIIPERQIQKNEYYVLCSTTNENEFNESINTIGISGFPSLTNSGQQISIYSDKGIHINSITYSDSWYGDPLKENGGWSLEKIDPKNNCNTSSNWKASENISGGTPGEINSVFNSNQDIIQPNVNEIKIIDSISINVIFSEEILLFGEIDKYSFELIEFGNHPSQITTEDNKSFNLTFDSIFIQAHDYSLYVTSLSDLCGHFINDTLVVFTYYKALFGDIIINEIMYDPEPSIDLPISDYIEIYNRAEFPISLDGMTLWINEKEITMASEIIYPQKYIIICPSGNAHLFGPFVKSMEILGSNDLTNSGKTLAITDKSGNVISSLKYNPNWHSSDYKSEGGWSLERIDFDNICEEKNNWTSSESSVGGTPGSLNSTYSENPDNINPFPIRAQLTGSNSVRVLFSEQMDEVSLSNKENYTSSGNLNNPIFTYTANYLINSVDLVFAEQISSNKIYSLTINHTYDCAWNLNNNDTVYFGIPQPCEPLDIVINEILFNPIMDGVDFIELYNRSNKIIDISNLLLATKSEYSQQFESIKEIATTNYLLFPQTYLILTSSSEKVLEQYYYNNPKVFISPVIQLPTMANSSGRIILLNNQETVIDDFTYTEEMHHHLLNSYEGVSLERINYDSETNNNMNWHSASETFGFATPGIKNSQYSDISGSSTALKLEPEIFSPDNDGTDDFLKISYSFDNPGFIGSITIYDSRGRIIKNLVANSLLSTMDSFIWDGTNNDGERVSIGIHIILFEYFNLSGKTKSIKKTCVLARKL